ncbi:MAG: hypothetical protein QME85_06855 [Candidatus Saccharicenans sp.]|nr:hypothetical protein [Candidatus Saccharicenans sp.]
MLLSALIIEAIDLEALIDEIYKRAAELALDGNIARELTGLAGEELDHASLLRAGRNYLTRAPEAFGEATISREELLQGLKATRELLGMIEGKKLLLSQILERLMKLEIQFEKIHLQTIVEIKDENLKKLFQKLSGEDRKHTERLSRLLESLK